MRALPNLEFLTYIRALLGVNLFTVAVVTFILEFWTEILDSVGALEAALLVLIVPLDRFCLSGLLSMWHERQSQTVSYNYDYLYFILFSIQNFVVISEGFVLS